MLSYVEQNTNVELLRFLAPKPFPEESGRQMGNIIVKNNGALLIDNEIPCLNENDVLTNLFSENFTTLIRVHDVC